MVKRRYSMFGPYFTSVVNGKECLHPHFTRDCAKACETERENYRAAVIPISRARARREER